jgi:hypothetical protein
MEKCLISQLDKVDKHAWDDKRNGVDETITGQWFEEQLPKYLQQLGINDSDALSWDRQELKQAQRAFQQIRQREDWSDDSDDELEHRQPPSALPIPTLDEIHKAWEGVDPFEYDSDDSDSDDDLSSKQRLQKSDQQGILTKEQIQEIRKYRSSEQHKDKE